MICKPVQEGGIGVRDLNDMQNALHIKFAWRLLSEDSLWSHFFMEKYVKQEHFSLADGFARYSECY